jgi:hypothetical protein
VIRFSKFFSASLSDHKQLSLGKKAKRRLSRYNCETVNNIQVDCKRLLNVIEIVM